MTFTYEPGGSTNRDKVRLLLGENVEASSKLSDEELCFIEAEFGPDIYATALAGVDFLIAAYAALADHKSVGPLSLSYANRIKNLQMKKAAITALAIKKGAPMPYAGGISKADKAIDEANPDLFHAVRVGGMDNPGGATEWDQTRSRDRHTGLGDD